MLAAYSALTLATIICARIDFWDAVIVFGLVALYLAFMREARCLRKRASEHLCS